MGSVIGYPEAHGAAATFETDVAEKIKSLIIDINPVQEGSGDPSPDNIRPITGWTGANITHHGKNIAQYWQNAYIGADGSIKTGSTYAMSKPVFVQNGRPIAVSNTAGDYQGIAVFSDSSLENMIYRLANTASTYTASQDCYVVCWFNKVYSEYTESNFVDRGVQIEYNYSPTNYEPYSHDEYDIEFPSEAGTVYGGKLDLVNGDLTVDRKTATFNGTEDWRVYVSDYNTTYWIHIDDKRAGIMTTICDRFENIKSCWSNAGSGKYGVFSDNNLFSRLYFRPPNESIANIDQYKAWLSDNNIQVIYELATPITYQLAPQEIDTIIGTNTIYADTGDVSVLYPKTLTPAETVSNVSLMELRRNIMMAMQHNYIPEITAYGVEWNYNDPSTVLKRTGAASKFANPIPAESLNEVGWSPFDNVYPWSEMKRYNIINGEVAYSEDDAGYSETDYDTMVYIPEFYYYAYKDTSNQKWNWSISAKPLEGYEKHPGSGCYVGRFHTSGSSSGVFSKGGVTPLRQVTRNNFRSYSHGKGAHWWQIDIATWSAIQMLYIIEFSNWYSQDILGNGNHSGSLKNTGETMGATYHTIKRTGSANSYRWFENLFSNLYFWVDGFVVSNKAAYISTNNATYGDSTSNMTATGIALPGEGWKTITGIGYSEKCSWAFIPDAASGGSGTTYVTDVVGTSASGLKALFVGGTYDGGIGDGLFRYEANYAASSESPSVGSLLIYKP